MWKSRGLFLFAAFCAILLVRFYDNKNIAFLSVYALVILVLASLAAVMTAPLFLKVEERTNARDIFKDDQLRYESRVKNRGIFFYPQVVCGYHSGGVIAYGSEACSITPRGAVDSGGDIRFPYRGVYQVGVKEITVTDFLGLFRLTFAVNNPIDVTVYPQSDEDFLVYIRSDSQNTAFKQDLYNESTSDVADVRKYAPSDSLRKIHWKLSAKRGELMVKNFHAFEPNETLIFIDPVRAPLEDMARAAFEDKIISYAAAAVDHCMLSRLSSALVYGGGEGERMPIDPAEDPDKLYRLLAQVSFDQQHTVFPAFSYTLERSANAYNILLFLWDVSDALFREISEFMTYDDKIYVYFFSCEALPLTPAVTGYLDGLRALGITVNVIEA